MAEKTTQLSKADCGIPMTQEESRQVQLDMLDALADFCEQHGLRYFLSGGTLLGAIRHHGFIPWDDDIDVNMPRPDCDKLLEITGGNLAGYRAVGPDEGEFLNCCNWYRLLDESTVVENFRRGATKDHPYYHPIFIDIFPMEGLPEGKIHRRLYWARTYCLEKMKWASSLQQAEAQSRAGKIFLVISRVPAKMVGYSRWGKRMEKHARKYDFEKQKYVGVTTTTHYLTREIVEREKYLDVVRVEFENKEYNAPGNYDIYLSQLYGDYMKMPPIERQQSHHAFNLFWHV